MGDFVLVALWLRPQVESCGSPAHSGWDKVRSLNARAWTQTNCCGSVAHGNGCSCKGTTAGGTKFGR